MQLVQPGTTVRYTPWKMGLIFQKPSYGSQWYYGNFSLGLAIDGHPRFYNVILCLLVFEIGLSFQREAVLVPPADTDASEVQYP